MYKGQLLDLVSIVKFIYVYVYWKCNDIHVVLNVLIVSYKTHGFFCKIVRIIDIIFKVKVRLPA